MGERRTSSRWRYIGRGPDRGVFHLVVFFESDSADQEVVTISACGAWLGPLKQFYDDFVPA